MKGITHLSVGVFLSSLLFFFNFLSYGVHDLFLVCSLLFGTLLPDIDKATSFIGRKVKVLEFIFSHRTFFHSFFGLWLVALFFLALFSWQVALLVLIGYVSHLLLDSYTPKGIKWFYPLGKRSKGNVRTGSVRETMLRIGFLVATGVLILLQFIF